VTKAEKKVYDKAYRLANREKLLQQHRDWLAKNPDYQAQYDLEHPRKEYHKKRSKQYYIEHTDEIKVNVAAYKEACKEADPEAFAAKVKATNMRWSKENKDKRNAITQNYQARKREAGGSYTAEEWIDLKASFGNVCLRCGTPEAERPLTVDHVIPVLLRRFNRHYQPSTPVQTLQ
jgi:hypothetical protein